MRNMNEISLKHLYGVFSQLTKKLVNQPLYNHENLDPCTEELLISILQEQKVFTKLFYMK